MNYINGSQIHVLSCHCKELKDRLNENINSIYAMIDSLSEEELFKPHMRKWADEATKTAVWEVYNIHKDNTVAVVRNL